MRTCLNPPTINNRLGCDGDQMQERECQVSCIEQKSEKEIYSTWSDCSACRGLDCVSQRTRECLQGSCENLIETRSCEKTICSLEPMHNNHLSSSIVYPSIGIGPVVLLFLSLFTVFICYRCRRQRRRRHVTTKKGTISNS